MNTATQNPANTTARTWTVSEVFFHINSSDKALTQAIIALYERQTSDEKVVKGTKYDNGRGFNIADAKLLSSYAQHAIKTGAVITGEWATEARCRLPKYRIQLVEIANERAVLKAAYNASKAA